METKETEQGRQYKEYTREATGNIAERSAQLLGGEFWYEQRSSTTRLEGSLGAACFFAYSSQSISWKREKRLPPVINQIEVHPLMTQEENIAYNHAQGIQVEAWGPFGQGDIDVIGHPLLQSLAAKYQKTASQIVLRWIVQRNLITIPRAKPSHFAENLEIMTFSLSDEDMQAISALNQNLRSNVLNDPETFPW